MEGLCALSALPSPTPGPCSAPVVPPRAGDAPGVGPREVVPWGWGPGGVAEEAASTFGFGSLSNRGALCPQAGGPAAFHRGLPAPVGAAPSSAPLPSSVDTTPSLPSWGGSGLASACAPQGPSQGEGASTFVDPTQSLLENQNRTLDSCIAGTGTCQRPASDASLAPRAPAVPFHDAVARESSQGAWLGGCGPVGGLGSGPSAAKSQVTEGVQPPLLLPVFTTAVCNAGDASVPVAAGGAAPPPPPPRLIQMEGGLWLCTPVAVEADGRVGSGQPHPLGEGPAGASSSLDLCKQPSPGPRATGSGGHPLLGAPPTRKRARADSDLVPASSTRACGEDRAQSVASGSPRAAGCDPTTPECAASASDLAHWHRRRAPSGHDTWPKPGPAPAPAPVADHPGEDADVVVDDSPNAAAHGVTAQQGPGSGLGGPRHTASGTSAAPETAGGLPVALALSTAPSHGGGGMFSEGQPGGTSSLPMLSLQQLVMPSGKGGQRRKSMAGSAHRVEAAPVRTSPVGSSSAHHHHDHGLPVSAGSRNLVAKAQPEPDSESPSSQCTTLAQSALQAGAGAVPVAQGACASQRPRALAPANGELFATGGWPQEPGATVGSGYKSDSGGATSVEGVHRGQDDSGGSDSGSAGSGSGCGGRRSRQGHTGSRHDDASDHGAQARAGQTAWGAGVKAATVPAGGSLSLLPPGAGMTVSVKRRDAASTVIDPSAAASTHPLAVVVTAEGRRYYCTFCAFSSPIAATVREHERAHTGTKPYKCAYCDFRCTQNGNLRCHERRHTGEKPFRCPLCPFAAVTSTGVKTHLRQSHPEAPADVRPPPVDRFRKKRAQNYLPHAASEAANEAASGTQAGGGGVEVAGSRGGGGGSCEPGSGSGSA